MGTPAVAVITTAFVDGSDRMAEVLGFPGYRYAIVTHPISSASADDLAVKAALTVRQAELILSLSH